MRWAVAGSQGLTMKLVQFSNKKRKLHLVHTRGVKGLESKARQKRRRGGLRLSKGGGNWEIKPLRYNVNIEINA